MLDSLFETFEADTAVISEEQLVISRWPGHFLWHCEIDKPAFLIGSSARTLPAFQHWRVFHTGWETDECFVEKASYYSPGMKQLREYLKTISSDLYTWTIARNPTSYFSEHNLHEWLGEYKRAPQLTSHPNASETARTG